MFSDEYESLLSYKNIYRLPYTSSHNNSSLKLLVECQQVGTSRTMGLLPNTSNCGCACAGNAGNVFPATAGKQSRHASRHVCDARAVMHAGIANSRFTLNSAAGGNVPGIPGACATRDFAYLVRGQWPAHHPLSGLHQRPRFNQYIHGVQTLHRK